MPAMPEQAPSGRPKGLLSLLGGVLHLLGGQAFRLVTQSLYLILLTRSLGAESFSKVTALMALFTALFPFTCLGTPMLVVRGVARHPRERARHWGGGLLVTAALGTLAALLLAFFAPALLGLSFPRPPLFAFAFGELTLYGVIQVLNSVLQAEERLRHMARVYVLVSAARLAIVAGTHFILGLDLASFCLAYLTGTALALSIAAWAYARDWGRPVFPRRLAELGDIAAKGIHISLAASGRSLLLGMDKMMLPALFGLVAAAQYGAGFRVVMFAFIPLQSLMVALFPRFFRRGGESLAESLVLWRRAAPLALTYALLMAVVLILVAPWIQPLLGEEFPEVAAVIRWLVWLLVLQALYVPLGDALTGADHFAYRSFSFLIAVASNLLLNLWLIPRWGWRGAAVAAYLSQSLLFVLYLLRIWRGAGGWRAVPPVAAGDLARRRVETRRRRLRELLDRAGAGEGRILVLAAGGEASGLEHLAPGRELTALDADPAALERARALRGDAPDAVFARGDADALDFPDGHFRLVLAVGALDGLRWRRWALQEIHRVLAPGGRLVLAVANDRDLGARLGLRGPRARVRGAARRLRSLAGAAPPAPGAGLDLWPRRLRAMLHDLGYEILAERHHGFGPLPGLGRLRGPSLLLDEGLQDLADRATESRLRDLAAEGLYLCRKRPAAASPAEHWLFADEDALARAFAERRRRGGARLDAWLRRHPRHRDARVRPLDERLDLAEPALVLSPHPDDELVGCGGTLLEMRGRGAALTILQLTDGAASAALRGAGADERRRGRLREAEAVAAELGAELRCWEFPDRGLAATPDTAARLAALLDACRPRVVFTPPWHDPHPDHAAAAALLAAALGQSGLDPTATLVACYEVRSPVPVNAVQATDAWLERKASLLMRYRYGMRVVDYVAACRVAEAAHARRHLGRRGFAEVFFVLPAAEFAALGDGAP